MKYDQTMMVISSNYNYREQDINLNTKETKKIKIVKNKIVNNECCVF